MNNSKKALFSALLGLTISISAVSAFAYTSSTSGYTTNGNNASASLTTSKSGIFSTTYNASASTTCGVFGGTSRYDYNIAVTCVLQDVVGNQVVTVASNSANNSETTPTLSPRNVSAKTSVSSSSTCSGALSTHNISGVGTGSWSTRIALGVF